MVCHLHRRPFHKLVFQSLDVFVASIGALNLETKCIYVELYYRRSRLRLLPASAGELGFAYTEFNGKPESPGISNLEIAVRIRYYYRDNLRSSMKLTQGIHLLETLVFIAASLQFFQTFGNVQRYVDQRSIDF